MTLSLRNMRVRNLTSSNLDVGTRRFCMAISLMAAYHCRVLSTLSDTFSYFLAKNDVCILSFNTVCIVDIYITLLLGKLIKIYTETLCKNCFYKMCGKKN